MDKLTLREYEPRQAVALTTAQLGQLRALTNSVAVSPSVGVPGRFDLTPGSYVGALRLDGLDVVIEPKIPIDRLLFMLSYAMGDVRWFKGFELRSANELPEAIVPGFVHQMQMALTRGAPRGYRSVDEASLVVRGRWRVSDQMSRRFGIVPPVEVTYDDFTADIELNRILLAATRRLLRLRLRSDQSRVGLRGVEARLEGVTAVDYDPRRVPIIGLDRLTERYRPAVELARLVVASISFDLGHGETTASAFLVNMNKAFEDFVVAALRDALRLSPRELVQGARGHSLFLDEERTVRLEPDLSIWREGVPVFVGDVKYKRLLPTENPNADIYQATAYAIAAGLDGALLIYASGEGRPGTHTVVNVGKRIEVVSLDLSGTPDEILAGVRAVAARIRAQLRQPGEVWQRPA